MSLRAARSAAWQSPCSDGCDDEACLPLKQENAAGAPAPLLPTVIARRAQRGAAISLLRRMWRRGTTPADTGDGCGAQ